MPAVARPRSQVLLIEDDQHLAGLLRGWLTQTGELDVSVVHDGTLAWDLLTARPWTLVVSDIGLPGCDGLTLLRRFRDLDDATPYLLVSGRSSIEDAHQAIRLRASEFLPKPLDRERFVTATADLIGSFTQAVRRRDFADSAVVVRQARQLLADGQNLVHTLANKVAPLVGWADLLAVESARVPADVTALDALRTRIDESAGAALHVLGKFRQLVTPVRIHDEPCDLGLAVHAASFLAGPLLAARGIRLDIRTSAGPVSVFRDNVGVRGLICGILIALAEDCAQLSLREATVSVSATAPGASVSFHLRRDLSALTADDPLVDLLTVFRYRAEALGATLQLKGIAGGSLVCVAFSSMGRFHLGSADDAPRG